MIGVKVTITKNGDYPTPYGLIYNAKGFYIQKGYIVVVGCIPTMGNPENTIRIKYPINDVEIEII